MISDCFVICDFFWKEIKAGDIIMISEAKEITKDEIENNPVKTGFEEIYVLKYFGLVTQIAPKTKGEEGTYYTLMYYDEKRVQGYVTVDIRQYYNPLFLLIENPEIFKINY